MLAELKKNWGMKERWVVTAVLALLACGLGGRAEACSCMPPGEPAVAFRRSDAVFLAKVVRIQFVRDTVTVDSSLAARHFNHPRYYVANDIKSRRMARAYQLVSLRVQKSWKGVKRGATLLMSTTGGGGDCSFPFMDKRRYLIYAGRDSKGQLGTSLCSRSKVYGQAAKDEARILNSLL